MKGTIEAPPSPEKEKTIHEINIDIVRHGETDYTGLPNDITDEGRSSIRNTIVEVISDIDKDKECVILWVSPAERTKASAEIILEELEKEEVPIVRQSYISSLRDRDWSFEDAMMGFKDTFPDMAESEITQKLNNLGVSETTEDMQEAQYRFRRVLEYIYRISENVYIDSGKHPRIVIVAHQLQPIELLEVSGISKDASHIVPSSHTKLSIKPSSDEIEVEFKGRKGKVTFDRKSREIT